MKVLIVCSGNVPDFSFEKNQAFIFDQVNAILASKKEITFSYYFIKGNGVFGYLENLKKIKAQVKSEHPDLIHAHYALSGLLSNFQNAVKVITTFHGSDINNPKYRLLSMINHYLGQYSIFVSYDLCKKINPSKKYSIIPCGVDFDVFKPMGMPFSRNSLNLDLNKRYILFSSSFNNPIKNFLLAQKAKNILDDSNVEIIEFKGYSRKESVLLFNAVNIALLTSFSEGSSQFIKEAMSCNCPIVSTDVGDVKEVIDETEGCFITSFDPQDVAEKIKLAMEFSRKEGRTNGRDKILEYDNRIVAGKIIEIYKEVVRS